MRVALITDFLPACGGAERVAIILANYLNADFYTTFIDRNLFKRDLKIKPEIREIGLFFKNIRKFTFAATFSETAFRFLIFRFPQNYDIYLFYGLHCIPMANKYHPNIWFCNSTVRSIFDLHEWVYSRLKQWKKPVFKVWCRFYKEFYMDWIRGCDKILANSINTAKKIDYYYKRKAKVLYPPIETDRYHCKGYEDFYLVPGRLAKEKRVDLVIEAFREMPHKQLIVTGDGPEKESLEKMTDGYPNIRLLGTVNFKELLDLYSTCAAVIYMPIDEDFGLVPLESMASGKPCIAANEGGCKETILHGETGFLIKPSKNELKKYVEMLTPENAKKMKEKCFKRAQKFDVKIFIKKMKKEIEQSINPKDILKNAKI